MKLGLMIITLIFASFTFAQEIKTEPIIEQPTERLFVFYTYGMPGPRDLIREKILEKWKIKYVAIAGCVIDDEILEKAKTQNMQTKKQLEAYYGVNWKKELEAEIAEAKEKLN